MRFMVLKFFLIFITALTIFAAESRSSDAEDLYIKSRNEFIKKYSRKDVDASAGKEETAALAQLEKLLAQAIGPIKFSSEFGEINLALSPYDDGTHLYGNVDGLNFASDKKTFFATTKTILTDYLSKHKELPKDFENLFKSDKFYSQIFNNDAAFSGYLELPIKSTDLKNSRAFLVLNAQDIGAFPPNSLIVITTRADKIFAAKIDLDPEIENLAMQIDACENTWAENKSDEVNFKAYKSCFAAKAKDEKFFLELISQAQKIADQF